MIKPDRVGRQGKERIGWDRIGRRRKDGEGKGMKG